MTIVIFTYKHTFMLYLKKKAMFFSLLNFQMFRMLHFSQTAQTA